MYLIFDCSATRKPLSYTAPYSDSFNWPKLLHLSWLVLDENFKPIEDHNAIIKPYGFEVNSEALRLTHLTQDQLDKGEDIKEVLEQFNKSISAAKYGFAHNLKFNESVITSALVAQNIKPEITRLETYCLMQEGTYFCRLPKKGGGFKWPSLQELHVKLYNKKYTPTNNARADVVAAAKCFIGLKQMQMLDDIFD